MDRPAMRLRRLGTAELTPPELRAVRELVTTAFAGDGEGFTDEDWAHAIGGRHVVLEVDGQIAAHASVVERQLHVDDRPIRTGYVEAVATSPAQQGTGMGRLVMEEVGSLIATGFPLGALSTGVPGFYERLGWLPWTGPTFVRTDRGRIRTPDDDGAILVLLTPTSPELDRSAAISCEWRIGDVW